MHENVHSLYIDRQAKCTLGDMALLAPSEQNVHMAYKPRHFLREWREFKGFTLEELADKIETLGAERNQGPSADLTYPDSMTHVTLSRIENGKQPYKQQLLEIIAEIYETDVASLIIRNPMIPDAPRDILDGLTDEQRSAVMSVVRQFNPAIIEGGKAESGRK